MADGHVVRAGTASDIPAITRIYEHAVLHSTATFEEVPPTESVMHQRWQDLVTQGYPYLVAAQGDDVLGYAYAGLHKARAAYRFTVEDSIYVAQHARGQGVGGVLLKALIEESSHRGFRQMIAVIGDSENQASVGVHTRQGFRQIGVAKELGYKFDRWVDIVFMQRALPQAPSDC